MQPMTQTGVLGVESVSCDPEGQSTSSVGPGEQAVEAGRGARPSAHEAVPADRLTG